MPLPSYYGPTAYAAGLALTLVLASWFTPRDWWRRPTARALCILAVGAWGIGTLLLSFVDAGPLVLNPASPGVTLSVHTAPAPDPVAGQPFQVHRDLNLRAAAGVNAPRLALVTAGASVTPTGLRDGDWWQVQAEADGRAHTGWVSSLWLRRREE